MTFVTADLRMEHVTPKKSARKRVEQMQVLALKAMESAAYVKKFVFFILNFNILQFYVLEVVISGGMRSSQNCTYVDSSGTAIGGISQTICPICANICQAC